MGALGLILYLVPGLLAILIFKPPERASTWLALAAPVSVAIQIAVDTALKIFVRPVTWEHRVLSTLVVAIALFIAVLVRRRRIPVKTPADVGVLICAVGVPLCFLLAFPDAILHRELSSDGVEAVEMARQLDSHVLPRWPSESGLKGFGQGLIALAFPNAWFGGDEGPRWTFLMFLGLIVAQVIALVEARHEWRLGWIAYAGISLSALAAAFTLGLNVSLDPYFADPGNPAGAEMMTVAMMLAAFLALLEHRTAVFLIAAVLAHATLPSGLLFLVVLGAAWFVITRSRRALLRVAAAVGLCILVTVLYEKLYVPHVLPPGVAMDAASDSLAGRMRLLIFTDFGRFAFLVIPCGIVPAFFLFAWKKQDAVACVATLTTAALFLFFFVLATYSPHYFAPAMVLALVPYWRWARSRKAAWVGLAGAAVGLVMSLPPLHAVPQPYRAIGATIVIGADRNSSLREVRVAADLLQRLAYLPWNDVDPTKQFVASGLQLANYASSRDYDGENPNPDWVVRRDSGIPVPEYQPVASQGGWALFARPGAKIESIRERGFPTDFQAPWYRVPRDALFRVFTERSHRYDLDLRAVFDRLR